MTAPSRYYIVPALAAVLALSSCARGPSTHSFSFTRFSMDTVIEYTVRASSHSQAREAVDAAQEELERVERLLWEESESSEIRRLNLETGGLSVHPEVADFLKRSTRYSEISGGAFDATIKPVLDLYGFIGSNPSRPSDTAISAALALVDYRNIVVDSTLFVAKRRPAAAVAVGGSAKGYAVDRAVALLKRHGITSAVVSAGGDAYCLGTNGGKPWRVGVRHPENASEIIAVIEVIDAGVATSGDYERFFEVDGLRYHHILDPRTGHPARGTRSASVVAATAEAADALATAVFVLGSTDGIRLVESLDDVHALVIDTTLSTATSTSFPLAPQ